MAVGEFAASAQAACRVKGVSAQGRKGELADGRQVATKQAHDELESLQKNPDYWTSGTTTELDAGRLGRGTELELSALGRELEEAALSEPGVIAVKAFSSHGVFGNTYENAIDFELATRNGYDPRPLAKKLISRAKADGQRATFLSRRTRPDEAIDPLFHRPGVEIYFRDELTRAKTEQFVNLINSLGFDGMTFQVNPIRAPEALSGKTGAKVGLRLQWVPEFDGSIKQEHDVGDLLSTWLAKSDSMRRLANRLSKEADVALAQRNYYETHVYDWSSYDQELANLDAGQEVQHEGDAGTGAGTGNRAGWRGQPIGRAFEIADRVFGDDASLEHVRSGIMDRRDQEQGLTGFPRFSTTRSDAASDGSTGEGASVQGYGTAIDRHSVRAVGVHYSKEQRDTLNSRFFGTGMKGEERARLMHAHDPRIKRRVYFYTGNETGRAISPESDVGAHAHSVTLNNLYDIDADPLHLIKYAVPNLDYRDQPIPPSDLMNYTEANILDAGYDGYITHEFGAGGAAVLLGDHSVPVKYEGMGVRPNVPAAQRSEPNDYLKAQKRLAARRDLPARQTGAEWKTTLPDIDLSHLDDTKTYYKDQITPKPPAGYIPGPSFRAARMSMRRALESSDALPNEPSGNRTLDAATLRDLRREAAGLERPERGTFLTVTQDGRAVATGQPGTRIPETFTRFADKHGLTLVARRIGPSTYGSDITPMSEPMPIEYRESGAAYFGESGVAIDRTGKTRFSPPRWVSTLAQSVPSIPKRMFESPKMLSAWFDSKAAQQMGLKQDEVQWSGVLDWLKMQKKVTREQLAEYLQQGGVKIEEVATKQEDPDDEDETVWSFNDPADPNDFMGYQTDWADKDEAIKQFIYFYTNSGRAIRPEAGDRQLSRSSTPVSGGLCGGL